MADGASNDDRWLTILFVVLLTAGIGLFAFGVVLAFRQNEFVVMAIGLLAIIVPASVYAVAGRGASQSGGGSESQVELLKVIADRLLLSDQARHIAYREKDRQLLRQAITDDIQKEDYDAAMALVNDMAETYGYREEAEKYRQHIIDAQTKKLHKMLDDAIGRIDALTGKKAWTEAREDVDRLMRMYPDYPQIQQLPQRLTDARQKFKQDLIAQFKEAYDRQDTDRASHILTEMDHHLQPEEAQPYMDMARAVLAQERDNMGVQFKMAIQDQDWQTALSVGEQIIARFPNSGFASEVREMLDKLRNRAAGPNAGIS